MSKLTGNNKDYLFKVSNFIKEIVLEDEINMTQIKVKVTKFVNSLVGEDVIDEESTDDAVNSLTLVLTVMLDNPKVGKFGKYFEGEDE